MPTIALIDDDPDIVEANRLLLESHGYRVVTAGCVDEAIKIVSHEKPDLIILDVMMQEADDGFYLASRFRRGGLTVPIIMLTSLTRAIGFNFGESASVPIQEFLEKPTAPAVLLEKIQRHLARVRPH
ncbi:MAG: response regulator [Bacteroidia bacterium]|nr:response regulator [Bacteroidia bacterium]